VPALVALMVLRAAWMVWVCGSASDWGAVCLTPFLVQCVLDRAGVAQHRDL